MSRYARPELKALCEKMDGKGLRRYVDDHHKELSSIKEEISEALEYASDPALMVLDAMDDFYRVNEDFRARDVRKTCVMLLEKLMNIVETAGISECVKEKAISLAVEWKGKISQKDSDSLKALGFLTLLAAYHLRNEFDENGIVDILVETANFKEAVNLCRVLIAPDKVPGTHLYFGFFYS